MTLEGRIRAFGPRYLGRELRDRDGVSESRIAAAEERLGLRLPKAVRAYYRLAGTVRALNAVHNRLATPARLEVFEGHLVFMDENQVVVSWGIRTSEVKVADPVVRQRNNTPPERWYSERKSFTAFMECMFDGYVEDGLLAHAH